MRHQATAGFARMSLIVADLRAAVPRALTSCARIYAAIMQYA
jgi:hypothetical protein